jgi:hypothetical protein
MALAQKRRTPTCCLFAFTEGRAESIQKSDNAVDGYLADQTTTELTRGCVAARQHQNDYRENCLIEIRNEKSASHRPFSEWRVIRSELRRNARSDERYADYTPRRLRTN